MRNFEGLKTYPRMSKWDLNNFKWEWKTSIINMVASHHSQTHSNTYRRSCSHSNTAFLHYSHNNHLHHSYKRDYYLCHHIGHQISIQYALQLLLKKMLNKFSFQESWRLDNKWYLLSNTIFFHNHIKNFSLKNTSLGNNP